MLYFLYGPNTFTAHQKIREITDHVTKKTGSRLAVHKFEEDAQTSDDLWEAFLTPSLFAKRRLFVARNMLSSVSLNKKLRDHCKKFAEGEDLVVIYEESPNKKLIDFLSSIATKIQKCDVLSAQQCISWARSFAKKLGATFSANQLQTFVDECKADQWKIVSEMEKVALGQSADEAGLPVSASPPMRKGDSKTLIFNFNDAVMMRRRRDAFVSLHRAVYCGVSPDQLIGIMLWGYKNMLLVYQGKHVGLHSFVVRKTRDNLSKWKKTEIQDSFIGAQRLLIQARYNSSESLYLLEEFLLGL